MSLPLPAGQQTPWTGSPRRRRPAGGSTRWSSHCEPGTGWGCNSATSGRRDGTRTQRRVSETEGAPPCPPLWEGGRAADDPAQVGRRSRVGEGLMTPEAWWEERTCQTSQHLHWEVTCLYRKFIIYWRDLKKRTFTVTAKTIALLASLNSQFVADIY